MIGVLTMAYGGPDNLGQVEPYLLDVRGHRPTSPEIVQEIVERYQQIGGRSPILELTRAQALALENSLNNGKKSFSVDVGMRHWHPYIQDSLTKMKQAGISRLVGLVMAPHYSRMSVEAYFKKIQESGIPVAMVRIDEWHLLPGYIQALAGRIQVALEKFPPEVRLEVPIIFSAHSLPERILEWNDPYPLQLQETMQAVMEQLGPHPHEFAYQSAAISSEPWLGPEVGRAIDRLAHQGIKNVLVAPIGFVCEHVEILYDVDIVYQRQARALGMHLERIEMLNTAPEMISGLAGLVRQKAGEAGWL